MQATWVIHLARGDSSQAAVVVATRAQPICVRLPPPAAIVGSGGHVWDAARVLSRFLATREVDGVCGKTVIELGAGAHGLPSIVSAALGAHRVIATDKDAAVPHLRSAIALNGLASSCTACALPWGCNIAKALRSAGEAPLGEGQLVVLLSDLLSLSPTLFAPLEKTLRDLFHAAHDRASARALIAFRSRDGKEALFIEGLSSRGWVVREVAVYSAAREEGEASFVSSEEELHTPVCIVEARWVV